MLYTIFSIQLIVVTIVACQPTSNESDGGQEGPENFHQSEGRDDEEGAYLLPGLDHGLLQSPINILSNQAEVGRHNITLNFTGEVDNIRNLGHTVQLDLHEGNTITVDDKTYEFKQMHFHTPSEHLIDGITYPMELHVVNTLKDQSNNETTEYLVIAFLIKMGEENLFMARFIDDIPGEGDQKDLTDLNILKHSKMGTAENLLKEYCYHYKGSLTTPPYTESVNWYLMKRIFEASPEQILRINEIEGDNARHIQEKYERNISTE